MPHARRLRSRRRRRTLRRYVRDLRAHGAAVPDRAPGQPLDHYTEQLRWHLKR